MIWDYFTSLDIGNFCRIDEGIDLYQKILEEDFLGTFFGMI